MRLSWVVLGLGNPGERYGGTRHNVGKDALRVLCSGLGGGGFPVKGRHFEGWVDGERLYAIQRCYMNESGSVVEELARRGWQADEWLVVHDDVALEVGRLRVARGGGSGGHRGVEGLSLSLGTDRFPRVKIGVGACLDVDRALLRDFVLSRFDSSEVPKVERSVRVAACAARALVSDGVNEAMNRFNPWPVS